MKPERREAIIRLLRTRDEHLPELSHRTETTAGFVHRAPARVTCSDCLANGRTMFGCETCGGRGYTEEHRERDPYATDAVVPFGFDGARHDATHERDRQIEILGQQLRPAINVDELADANAHPYAWERARKRMYNDFDYGSLDAALEQLRATDDAASRALHAVYVYRWQAEPNGPLLTACERGIAFLHARLPDPLRVPDERAPVVNTVARGRGADRRALDQRDEAVTHAITEGAPTVRVARTFGLSVRQVNRIVQQRAALRPMTSA